MALLSFADSTPRAYRLKAGNACLPSYFNIDRDIPRSSCLIVIEHKQP
jgi:hypothetical protein